MSRTHSEHFNQLIRTVNKINIKADSLKKSQPKDTRRVSLAGVSIIGGAADPVPARKPRRKTAKSMHKEDPLDCKVNISQNIDYYDSDAGGASVRPEQDQEPHEFSMSQGLYLLENKLLEQKDNLDHKVHKYELQMIDLKYDNMVLKEKLAQAESALGRNGSRDGLETLQPTTAWKLHDAQDSQGGQSDPDFLANQAVQKYR